MSIYFIEVRANKFDPITQLLESIAIDFVGDEGFKTTLILSETETAKLVDDLRVFGTGKFALMKRLQNERSAQEEKGA